MMMMAAEPVKVPVKAIVVAELIGHHSTGSGRSRQREPPRDHRRSIEDRRRSAPELCILL
jgi:hypothetical protein